MNLYIWVFMGVVMLTMIVSNTCNSKHLIHQVHNVDQSHGDIPRPSWFLVRRFGKENRAICGLNTILSQPQSWWHGNFIVGLCAIQAATLAVTKKRQIISFPFLARHHSLDSKHLNRLVKKDNSIYHFPNFEDTGVQLRVGRKALGPNGPNCSTIISLDPLQTRCNRMHV